jgi:hypothetical protein
MYEVIDNFIAKNNLEDLKNILMTDDFPWFFSQNVNSGDTNNFYFTHTFFCNSNVNSTYFFIVKPILNKLNIKHLIRVKGNLYPKTEQLENHGQHIDYDFEHKGAIFYINTNNGFTVLEDGTKIESVENRLLIFDAYKMHNSTNCTDQKIRMNINFNYI